MLDTLLVGDPGMLDTLLVGDPGMLIFKKGKFNIGKS